MELLRDTATTDDVLAHLMSCDADFTPPLSARVGLRAYAAKLTARAACSEAWEDGRLVGLVAAYVEHGAPAAFVTNVSVLAGHRGRGIAADLVADCIARAREAGATSLELEVATADAAARRFYARLGFTERDAGAGDRPRTTLALDLRPDPR